MGRQQPVPRRVLHFIREHNLTGEQALLVVGVSGGPDSVCLIHLLHSLSETLGIKLHIAHLNHLLRGAESDADAEYVSALARELGIPATIERRGIKAYQKEHRLSLEEAAREVRYAFLSEVALSLGVNVVAVGHTADDQIETILMHLVRGTGLAGLRGMKPLTVIRSPGCRELKVVRPLLKVTRAETEAYCTAHGLAPRSDSSNISTDLRRNKIRSQLIPLLRDYNPDVDGALLRMASAVDGDLAYIEKEASRVWSEVATERPDGIAIDKEEFARLHPALRRHLVRFALQHLLGDLRDIESVHVESLLDGLAKPAGKKLSLARGVAFHGDYSYGLITTNKTLPCPFPALEGEHCLKIPGETEICGWRVRSSIVNNRGQKEGGEEELKACFDLDAVGKKLTVRGRRRGDRFQPLGMESLKKVQDFMVDVKIPRLWRDRVPLVCSPRHIIWAVGWRIDHRARVTPSTKRVLCLKFERAKSLDK